MNGDTADAFLWLTGIGGALFLLFRYTRPSLVFIGILLTVVMVAASSQFVYDELKARKVAKIEGVAFYNDKNCSDDFPMFIGIVNYTSDTIEKVEFHVEGHREGHSDPLYRTEYPGYSSDRILGSGEGYGYCYTRPRQARGISAHSIALFPPETLVWTVTSIRPTFR